MAVFPVVLPIIFLLHLFGYEVFYSFEELKAAVFRKLDAFNRSSFQKREGSRYEACLDEKPFLHPLPSIPYEIATWVYGRKVNIDFHVVFECNRYSAVLRLGNKYSEARLEAACEFAVTSGIKKPRYHHLSSILASNQDEIYMEQKKASARAKTPMGYLRGSDYYGGGRNDQ